jgi:hypothetical protein
MLTNRAIFEPKLNYSAMKVLYAFEPKYVAASRVALICRPFTHFAEA